MFLRFPPRLVSIAPKTFDDGSNMLRADYSIDCDAAEHGRYRVLAGTMAVVYPLGVFTFYTFVLWRRRHLLYPMQVRGRPREDKAIAEEAKRLNELALRPFAILHDACEQGDSACVVLRAYL